MAITDTAIRNAEPKEKPYSLADERGLSILIQPAGGKWWRFRYRFDGKAKMLSFGIYPDVGLADARERREAARLNKTPVICRSATNPLFVNTAYRSIFADSCPISKFQDLNTNRLL